MRPCTTQVPPPKFASFTLKASDSVAQGKRSGEAAERHPGFLSKNHNPNPEGVAQTVVEPLQGSSCLPKHPPQGGASLALGFVIEPLRGSPKLTTNLCGTTRSQPPARQGRSFRGPDYVPS